MTIAVLHGGGRPNGNTETITKMITKDLDVKNIYLKEYVIKPIFDQRHDENGFDEVDDDYNAIIDEILKQDILLFSTPIYWYSMTATMKGFIDRFSQTMRDKNYPHFKEQLGQKKAFVIAVGGDSPYTKGLPMIQQFHHIFDFLGIPFAGYMIGNANKPNEIMNDPKSQSDAEQLRRILQESL